MSVSTASAVSEVTTGLTTTDPKSDAHGPSSGGDQQQQTATEATKRTTNTTAYLPIVYGSIAFFLGKKKSDEYNTHEWTLFVRGPNQEDLSPAISKVVFQLHPSFAQPTRELTEPPYEVTERGWGEFEAQIRIHWRDTAEEQSTVVNHTIRLYPPGTPPNVTQSSKAVQNLEKPVLAEVYDEVVFTNPIEDFYQALQQIEHLPKIELASATSGSAGGGGGGDDDADADAAGPITAPSSRQSQLRKEHVEYYNDEEDFLALVAAQRFLKDELSKVKRRFEVVTDEMISVDRAIASATKAAAVQQSQQRARDAQRQQVAAAGSGSNKSISGGVGSGSSSGKKRPSTTPKISKKPPSKKVKTSSSTSAAANNASTSTSVGTKSAK